jgi:hypothetical protein
VFIIAMTAMTCARAKSWCPRVGGAGFATPANAPKEGAIMCIGKSAELSDLAIRARRHEAMMRI